MRLMASISAASKGTHGPSDKIFSTFYYFFLKQHNKREHECITLRERTAELEDKTAFLSSKVKEISKELWSSHTYIDQLYSHLHSKGTPSDANGIDIERKEFERSELERGYTRCGRELKGRLDEENSTSKISMGMSTPAIQETPQLELKSLKKQQVFNVHEPLVKTGGGKSIESLQNNVKQRQIVPSCEQNDENKAPHGQREQLFEGKQFSRIAAVKAAGGRKGLSEQLKRARRFGDNVHFNLDT